MGLDGIAYTIGPAEGLGRGTKIILKLKGSPGVQRSSKDQGIIRQYSSFVPFPIKVNGEQINTVQALWVRNKNEVTGEEYTEFYKFLFNAYDGPPFTTCILQLRRPCPSTPSSLCPSGTWERFGFGRLEPGQSILPESLDQQQSGILPEWLRFVRGVVDSEDIPQHLPETMQDSALLRRLRRAVTGRFLKFLQEQSQKIRTVRRFGTRVRDLLKEGCLDYPPDDLVRLLRFESSASGRKADFPGGLYI